MNNYFEFHIFHIEIVNVKMLYQNCKYYTYFLQINNDSNYSNLSNITFTITSDASKFQFCNQFSFKYNTLIFQIFFNETLTIIKCI